MTNYAQHVSTRQTPQSEPIPGKPMVENSAGGFAFKIDKWKRLDRFLILGNEGGTYYAGERELTQQNASCIQDCANDDYTRTVDRIVEISDGGRAPKNDPAIFALALIAGTCREAMGKQYALQRMPEVCRIGTHLFQFIEAIKQFRGLGTTVRRAIRAWYERDDVAFQVCKYQQRNGVSHRDLLRLSHDPGEGQNTPLMRWIIKAEMGARLVKGKVDASRKLNIADRKYPATEGELPEIVQAFEEAKRAESAATICRLIEAHNLPRECIPTKWLNDPSVWEALLVKMPLEAMIRNLGKMSNVGLVSPMSAASQVVVGRLGEQEKLYKSRIHPIKVLTAMLIYGAGHGDKGKLTWTPVPQVIDALDGAFYKSFKNVEPTGKRWLLGCDVSGSMDSGTIAGAPGLTPRVGVGALALVTANVEQNYHVVGFTSGAPGEWVCKDSPCKWAGYGSGYGRTINNYNAVVPIPLSPRQRLDDVCKQMAALPMGGTDCALPMLYATAHNIDVDVFVVLTDNETWANDVIHPVQALEQYRQKVGHDAKLIVVGMTATEFSIADQNDPSMLDVVGFDSNAPAIMADFVCE